MQHIVSHRWFLIGEGTGRAGLSNYALDRIESIAASRQPYLPSPANLAGRFADVVGVSGPAESCAPKLIQLRFRAGRGQYVRTKPLHPSQQLGAETADALAVTLRVVPTPELETLLLSFGDDVQVRAPASLRERVGQRLRVVAAHYAQQGTAHFRSLPKRI